MVNLCGTTHRKRSPSNVSSRNDCSRNTVAPPALATASAVAQKTRVSRNLAGKMQRSQARRHYATPGTKTAYSTRA